MSRSIAITDGVKRDLPVTSIRGHQNGHGGEVATRQGNRQGRWRNELLHRLTSGTTDTYEAYRSLYSLIIGSTVPELRPLFTIPGIERDGQLSVTEDFKRQVLSSATVILANLQD